MTDAPQARPKRTERQATVLDTLERLGEAKRQPYAATITAGSSSVRCD